MSIVAGSAVALSVGDGADPEIFHPLSAVTLHSLRVGQQLIDDPSIAADAWARASFAAKRRLTLTCDAASYENAALQRLRAAALSGAAVHIVLAISASENWSGAGIVTQYNERAAADDAKRVNFTFSSVSAVLSAPA